MNAEHKQKPPRWYTRPVDILSLRAVLVLSITTTTTALLACADARPPATTATLAAADDPAVTIVPLPDNGAVVFDPGGTDVTIAVTLTNAAVEAGALHLRYWRDGVEVATVPSDAPFTFHAVPAGRRQLAAQLVQPDGAALPNPESLAKAYVKVLAPCPGGPDECEDGLDCSAHACTAGVCNYGPLNPCCDHDLECPWGWSCVGGQCQECVAADGQCDDGDPCTTDACDATSGTCSHAQLVGCCSGSGQPCDDGDPCTPLDLCSGPTTCVGTGQLPCDDGNPCTDDSCSPGLGCAATPITAPCDDGNACTTDDTCQGGACLGTPIDCAGTDAAVTIQSPTNNTEIPWEPAGTEVTLIVAVSDAVIGPETFHLRYYLDGAEVGESTSVAPFTFEAVPFGRRHLAVRVVQPDGEILPSPASVDGIHVRVIAPCEVGDSATCEDGLTCSAHNCFGGECSYGPAALPACCDHDLECPYAWVCVDHTCVECFADEDCTDFDSCTVDVCTPAQTCTSQPIGGCCYHDTDCDDADACTADTCDEGICVYADFSASCDLGDPCRDYGCDPLQGCTAANNQAPCDDDDVCTLGDACLGGQCEPGAEALPCDDGDPCTDDLCDPADGCLHVPNEAPCDDDDACTAGDTCVDGACQSGVGLSCDDHEACTSDSCDPLLGCVFAALGGGAPCDDADACTAGDACDGDGACAGAPVDCDDADLCTDDACAPATGCTHTPNTAPCDDGDPCTIDDTCQGGACAAGSPADCDDGDACTLDTCAAPQGCSSSPAPASQCDDGDPCTDDACDPAAGCQHDANDAPCDDGNPCTLGDACAGGACAGDPIAECADGDPCTLDSCDPATGACAFPPQDGPCDDGDPCTSDDACQGGACAPGPPTDCDDEDPCTDDTCAPGSGCVSTPSATPCDDGNPCTDDHCAAGVGCQATPNDALCDDEDPCTTGDACLGGLCAGTPLVDCDDGDPCTDDTCDPVQGGCAHTHNSASCDDGDPCTEGDACQGGACAGAPVDCDDDDPCTDDACDPTAGDCVATPNAAPCDDADVCTLSDACQDGACWATAYLDCDDGDPCTVDGCAPDSGCFYQDVAACAGPEPGPEPAPEQPAAVEPPPDASVAPDAAAPAEDDTGPPADSDASSNLDVFTAVDGDADPPTDTSGPATAPPAGGGCSCRAAGRDTLPTAGFILGLLILALSGRRRLAAAAPRR